MVWVWWKAQFSQLAILMSDSPSSCSYFIFRSVNLSNFFFHFLYLLRCWCKHEHPPEGCENDLEKQGANSAGVTEYSWQQYPLLYFAWQPPAGHLAGWHRAKDQVQEEGSRWVWIKINRLTWKKHDDQSLCCWECISVQNHKSCETFSHKICFVLSVMFLRSNHAKIFHFRRISNVWCQTRNLGVLIIDLMKLDMSCFL